MVASFLLMGRNTAWHLQRSSLSNHCMTMGSVCSTWRQPKFIKQLLDLVCTILQTNLPSTLPPLSPTPISVATYNVHSIITLRTDTEKSSKNNALKVASFPDSPSVLQVMESWAGPARERGYNEGGLLRTFNTLLVYKKRELQFSVLEYNSHC